MRTRLIVRMLVINERDEVLLIQHEEAVAVDQKQPDPLLEWAAPGGGLEEYENYEEAAVRELREETGITDAAIGPWMWTSERVVANGGEYVRRYGRYHLVSVGDPAVSFAHIEGAERPVFKDIRWWTLAELRERLDIVLLPCLPELVAPILAGRLPESPLTLPW